MGELSNELLHYMDGRPFMRDYTVEPVLTRELLQACSRNPVLLALECDNVTPQD